jgi:hypothetical protein
MNIFNYKIIQNVGSIEKTNSYGTWLPDILLKYTFLQKILTSALFTTEEFGDLIIRRIQSFFNAQ